MAIVNLPASLVDLFPGAPRRLHVEAATVEELLCHLDRSWPGMLDRLCDPGPVIREHINIFVNGEKAATGTLLDGSSVVRIIPAVSGG